MQGRVKVEKLARDDGPGEEHRARPFEQAEACEGDGQRATAGGHRGKDVACKLGVELGKKAERQMGSVAQR